MNLLYRWIDSNIGWKPTSLKAEKETVLAFHDLEEAKKRLINREILLCGVKLLRLYNGVL